MTLRHAFLTGLSSILLRTVAFAQTAVDSPCRLTPKSEKSWLIESVRKTQGLASWSA